MTSPHLTVTPPRKGPATAPQPKSPKTKTLGRLEPGFAGTLGMPRREPDGGTAEAGAIEYASWMPGLRPSGP